jgi:superfamily II DNA or RNA helicase/HKD family nuclease
VACPVTIVDVDTDMLDEARRRIAPFAERVRFREAASSIRFPPPTSWWAIRAARVVKPELACGPQNTHIPYSRSRQAAQFATLRTTRGATRRPVHGAMASIDPGPRDHLITSALARVLAQLDPAVVLTSDLDAAEAAERLARHVMAELRTDLADDDSADDKAQRVNRLLETLGTAEAEDAGVVIPAQLLTGILPRSHLGDAVPLPPPPATPFSQSDLLVNAEGQPNVGSELRAELETADSVDLICAFEIWTGVRHLRDALAAVCARGGRVRVITTTYMGATEKRAVDELVSLGADVRVAFDARTTKLHAKAWLLERPSSGLSTAFVGSSNLSHTALFDGLEWNVRLSSIDAPHVVDRVRMTFESHWASEHFERYDPDTRGEDLLRALRDHNRRSLGETSTISFANLDVRPYPHQQRMLEALAIERDRHDRHRNLVVAATGTGKTVVAALDYAELRKRASRDLSLLFVAHREEILRQSLATYRAVLRDGSFGEIHGGGRIGQGRHLFGMVQSLQEARLDQIAPDAFDVVVVDEFHHAAAKTYDRLLTHLRPRELLGLTATPERMDGKDVTEWFDQRIAVELRLWEAVDQGFLVPFQYFGVADGTDLSELTWRRGGYAPGELSDLLSHDALRVAKLLAAIERIVHDPNAMRALGFCVSKEHAHYMAQQFCDAGLPSAAVTGDDSPAERAAVLGQLKSGELRCVFSVEVLGEGVDVPDVDVLLLLRPTASATVFSQQLGRGLRRAAGKSHLTVIDLIGQQHREFRFEERFRAILDTKRGSVLDQVRGDFPFLPAGCTVDLDRQSEEIVLDNLRAATRRTQWAMLVRDLKDEADGVQLSTFLQNHGQRLANVYRSSRSWTELRRAAGHTTQSPANRDFESHTLKGLARLAHVDDPERVAFYREVIQHPAPPREQDFDDRRWRLLTMLAWRLGSGRSRYHSLTSYFRALWAEGAVLDELDQLLAVLDAASRTREQPSLIGDEVPLTVHARYSREEVIAALGYGEGVKPKVTQGGILWVPQVNSDVFFIDLHKSERDYSPTTMYRDYAISRQLFHWESQSRQTSSQPTVQRYIAHETLGTRVLLFVRERKTFELGTQPFTYLGPVTYVEHQGERPVAFTWRLAADMPEELFEVARSVAAV